MRPRIFRGTISLGWPLVTFREDELLFNPTKQRHVSLAAGAKTHKSEWQTPPFGWCQNRRKPTVCRVSVSGHACASKQVSRDPCRWVATNRLLLASQCSNDAVLMRGGD